MWRALKIGDRIGKAGQALRSIGYSAEEITSQEFCDYMTGETFSGDNTTLVEVLENKYLLIHELVEIVS